MELEVENSVSGFLDVQIKRNKFGWYNQAYSRIPGQSHCRSPESRTIQTKDQKTPTAREDLVADKECEAADELIIYMCGWKVAISQITLMARNNLCRQPVCKILNPRRSHEVALKEQDSNSDAQWKKYWCFHQHILWPIIDFLTQFLHDYGPIVLSSSKIIHTLEKIDRTSLQAIWIGNSTISTLDNCLGGQYWCINIGKKFKWNDITQIKILYA